MDTMEVALEILALLQVRNRLCVVAAHALIHCFSKGRCGRILLDIHLASRDGGPNGVAT